MKRFLTTALILGSFTPFGLLGCGEESKVQTETTVKTPEGETTRTDTTKIDSKGDNPPPVGGETATTPK